MSKMYSVKLLFESTTKPLYSTGKVFEERIILVHTTSKEHIPTVIESNFQEDCYENSEGGWTTVKLAAILDVFELVDSIDNSTHLTEVYSRYLILDEELTSDEVIKRYSLDQ